MKEIIYDKPVKCVVQSKEWFISHYQLQFIPRICQFAVRIEHNPKFGIWFTEKDMEEFGGKEVVIIGHFIDDSGNIYYKIMGDDRIYQWIDEMFINKTIFHIPEEIEINSTCI